MGSGLLSKIFSVYAIVGFRPWQGLPVKVGQSGPISGNLVGRRELGKAQLPSYYNSGAIPLHSFSKLAKGVSVYELPLSNLLNTLTLKTENAVCFLHFSHIMDLSIYLL